MDSFEEEKRELKLLWAKYRTVFLWLANKQTYREFILIIHFYAVFWGDLNSPFYVTCLVRVVYIFMFFNYFKVTETVDSASVVAISYPSTKETVYFGSITNFW